MIKAPPYYNDGFAWKACQEQTKLDKCVSRLRPYKGINDLRILRIVNRLYNCIISNHISRGLDLCIVLMREECKNLPKWLWRWYHKNTDLGRRIYIKK